MRWEGPDALPAGKHTLEYDFKYDGLGFATLAFNNLSGLGRGGTGTFKVDGKVISTQTDVPQGSAEGIVTAGGRFGGYGLYLLKGKPMFLWNLLDLTSGLSSRATLPDWPPRATSLYPTPT